MACIVQHRLGSGIQRRRAATRIQCANGVRRRPRQQPQLRPPGRLPPSAKAHCRGVRFDRQSRALRRAQVPNVCCPEHRIPGSSLTVALVGKAPTGLALLALCSVAADNERSRAVLRVRDYRHLSPLNSLIQYGVGPVPSGPKKVKADSRTRAQGSAAPANVGLLGALDHALAAGYDRVQRHELATAALAVANEPLPNRWEHAHVEQPDGSTFEAMRPARTRLARIAVVLAIVGLAAYAFSRRSVLVHTPRRPDPLSPYRNTAANVKYVGDAVCARCHGAVAASYQQHPMGRSLIPISGVVPPAGKFDDGRPLFVSHGLEYSIENRAGHVFHQESRRDATGQVITRNEAEVHFLIGSGRRAVGYLVKRDGFLFESPITWYTQKQRWDLSPGFERTDNHFDRAISPTCLYCHANRVLALAGPDNRYEPPIFQGHAIGCERCHGPGELHAAEPIAVDGRDTTIVNPADLESPLRDAVCEQCHLGGEHRIVRTHRRAEDFRPGLPFDRFWTVFVERSSAAGDRLIGQVEQMHASRCYRVSKGKLGCISCHDPHSLPPAGRSVAYYRDRCLSCHQDHGCALAAGARLKGSPDNNCAGCHMPRMESSDVPHVATTNHRILRNLPAETSSTKENQSGRRLVPFHEENADALERRALDRDRGVALCRHGTEERGKL